MQARRGEGDNHVSFIVRLHPCLRIVQHPVVVFRGCFDIRGHLFFRRTVGVVHLDAPGQRVGEDRLGLLLCSIRGRGLHFIVELLKIFAGRSTADGLVEHQHNVGVHPGVLADHVALRVLDLGVAVEVHIHLGRVLIGGVDGHMLHAHGEIPLLVLGHEIQLIGGFGLQAGDVQGARLAHGELGVAGSQGVHTGFHLDFGIVAGQIHGSGAGLRPGIGGAGRGHHGPVHGGVFVDLIRQIDRIRPFLRDVGQSGEEGRGHVVGGELHRHHGGAVGPVGVGEPQVQHVVLQLAQRPVVHLEGALNVFGHIQHTVAQIAAQRAGFHVLLGGGGGSRGEQGVVQLTGLVGHHQHPGLLRLGLGHPGIAVVERGHRVVGGGKGGDFYRALPALFVHQYGGDVIGAVADQARGLTGGQGIGGGDGDAPPLHGLGAVRGRVNQLIRAQGAVGQGGNRPVDGALFVGFYLDFHAGGGHVGGVGVAGQDLRIPGGLLRGGGVHHRARDVGRQAGTDVNLVRQHLHGTPGGVDVQGADVALSVHLGAGVQVQFPDSRSPVNNDCAFGGPLVHSELFHRSLGHLDGGVGGHVNDFLHPAGQVQLGLLPIGVKGNGFQAVFQGGVVLQIGGGFHCNLRNHGGSLHPHGDVLVLQGVHHHLVRLDVAQDQAGLALLALAGAAHDNAAQNLNIFQLHIAQIHAAADVQVAGDGGVFQLHTGAGDGHVAEHVAQLLLPGLLEGGADDVADQGGHFSPGYLGLGAEGAVGVAVDDVLVGGRLYQAPAPVADIPGVGKVQVLAAGLLQQHIVAQNDHGLLPGEGGVGGGRRLRGTRHIAGVVSNAHVLIEPVAGTYVGKGDLPHLVVAIGPVDHRHEFGPGHGFVVVGGLVRPHEAPPHKFVQVGGSPAVRPADRSDGGHKAHHQNHCQQQGEQPVQTLLHCVC